MQQPQQHPQQQQQVVVAPPPPPREIVPVRLQQGPLVQLSDIRKERLTEAEAREELSTYIIFRFERADAPDSYDSDGERVKPTWANVYRTEVRGVSQKEAAREVRFLNERTRPIGEKKASLNTSQQRQLEKVQEEITFFERDQRFQTVLVQMDHQLRPKPKDKDRDKDRERDRDSSRHVTNKKDRRAKEYKEEKEYRDRKESWARSSVFGRQKSLSAKDGKKKIQERVSITAYYKRSPRPDVDAIALVMQRDAEIARRLQPPHPQQVHPPQQPQQMQQPQQFRPPGQSFHDQQQMPMGQNPAGVKGVPQKQGGGGGGGVPIQIVKGKQPDKKGASRSKSPSPIRSYSQSDSSTDDDDDDMSIRTPTSSNSSSLRSSNRYRHPLKRGDRYIEEPGHYGVPTRIESYRNRGLAHDEHRISDEYLVSGSPAPRAGGGPRFAPMALPPLQPVPPVDIERITAEYYEAGRQDERAETHERLAEQLSRPRVIQRQPQRLLSDRPAHPSEVVMIEEERPRPRPLQRHPSIRIVRPGNVDLLEQESIERMERLRFEEERRYEEAIQQEEYEDWVERQRARDIEDRIRDEIAREDELREEIARERDREYRSQSYVRRVDVDPSNPFSPRPGVQRRVSVSYPARRYDP